jgi:hypothetical protein
MTPLFDLLSRAWPELRLSVQRERITPPGYILPPTKVGQHLGRACLSNQGEIIEPELLEAAAKPPTVL